uniref:Uncharacterized protein n=1 Tax=Arundo donax TaxID=35708 RepID=A0A0A8ZRA0_ARUDO
MHTQLRDADMATKMLCVLVAMAVVTVCCCLATSAMRSAWCSVHMLM